MGFYAHGSARATGYSQFHRSKTHLVYTTEDLRVRVVDRIHFFGRVHPENWTYAPRIGKVGLTRLELPVEPRFADAYAWYVAADPAATPGLEYSYLQGNEGPHIETRNDTPRACAIAVLSAATMACGR
jgi:hypothetical protein